LDYTLVGQRGHNLLRVMAVEKAWGPRLSAAGPASGNHAGTGIDLPVAGGLPAQLVECPGGEMLLSGELGSTSGVATEIYQLLEPTPRYFAGAQASCSRTRNDYAVRDQRIGEHRRARSQLDLTTGINFTLLAQLRLGWREVRVNNQLETAADVFSLVEQRSSGGWLLATGCWRWTWTWTWTARTACISRSAAGNARPATSTPIARVTAS